MYKIIDQYNINRVYIIELQCQEIKTAPLI